MPSTLPKTEWKPKESTGEHSQVPMPFLAAVQPLQLVPTQVISKASFNGALVEAARHSGMDDYEIADAIHVSHGYMSKFMRGVGQQWARRMVSFMRATNSLAPLQWLADQMGCDLVQRDPRAAKIKELEDQLEAMRRGQR